MKYPYWLVAVTLILSLSLIGVGASADGVFTLESDGLLTIPAENLEFLEGVDETTPFYICLLRGTFFLLYHLKG